MGTATRPGRMYKSDGRAAQTLSVMIAFVLLAVGSAAASGAQPNGVLGSLAATLKLVSAQSIDTARAAVVPVLEVANQTALDARSTLKDLGGDVTVAVLKAQASGWDAAQCAQDKEKQAQEAIQRALAKLEGCTALAAVEAQEPAAVIQNLTQEALQRIDTATGGVAACLGATGTIMCLVNVMRNAMQEVDAVARLMTRQALSAEQSVVHIARYITSCAAGQVQSARRLVQQLNITGCTQ